MDSLPENTYLRALLYWRRVKFSRIYNKSSHLQLFGRPLQLYLYEVCEPTPFHNTSTSQNNCIKRSSPADIFKLYNIMMTWWSGKVLGSGRSELVLKVTTPRKIRHFSSFFPSHTYNNLFFKFYILNHNVI